MQTLVQQVFPNAPQGAVIVDALADASSRRRFVIMADFPGSPTDADIRVTDSTTGYQFDVKLANWTFIAGARFQLILELGKGISAVPASSSPFILAIDAVPGAPSNYTVT